MTDTFSAEIGLVLKLYLWTFFRLNQGCFCGFFFFWLVFSSIKYAGSRKIGGKNEQK